MKAVDLIQSLAPLEGYLVAFVYSGNVYAHRCVEVRFVPPSERLVSYHPDSDVCIYGGDDTRTSYWSGGIERVLWHGRGKVADLFGTDGSVTRIYRLEKFDN